jgi:hypothetical protein
MEARLVLASLQTKCLHLFHLFVALAPHLHYGIKALGNLAGIGLNILIGLVP